MNKTILLIAILLSICITSYGQFYYRPITSRPYVYDRYGNMVRNPNTMHSGRRLTELEIIDSMNQSRYDYYGRNRNSKKQALPKKMNQDSITGVLFVVDSIPLLNNPEKGDDVLVYEDISNIFVIRSKDSLIHLGWSSLDSIMYIFTKEYNNRPDSIKKIPSRRQMRWENEAWCYHNKPYTGRFIDYYNTGKIWTDGKLLNGKIEGKFTAWFKNGNLKFVHNLKNEMYDDFKYDYYENGALKSKIRYRNGRKTGYMEEYLADGRMKAKTDIRKGTRTDSLITYYSTGKIKKIELLDADGMIKYSVRDKIMNLNKSEFAHYMFMRDLKEANKSLYRILKHDSTSAEVRLMEGEVLFKEFRFNEAIVAFDKALEVEPLMSNALVQRALAYIKKNQYTGSETFLKERIDMPLDFGEFLSMPEDEQKKVCNDLQLVRQLSSDSFIKQYFPEEFLMYCDEKNKFK